MTTNCYAAKVDAIEATLTELGYRVVRACECHMWSTNASLDNISAVDFVIDNIIRFHPCRGADAALLLYLRGDVLYFGYEEDD